MKRQTSMLRSHVSVSMLSVQNSLREPQRHSQPYLPSPPRVRIPGADLESVGSAGAQFCLYSVYLVHKRSM